MRIAVVGGGLQGTEAVYLAKKAGWQVILLDKKKEPPAFRLADRFIGGDVTAPGILAQLTGEVDLVLPALEDEAALLSLERFCRDSGLPLAFDSRAYRVSASKLASDRLFSRLAIPAPRTYPNCGFPLVVKPDRGSGSQGVKIIHNPDELSPVLPDYGQMVIQEYLAGPSYSLEVLGFPGHYRAIQVTGLFMDAAYDCKRVRCPTGLPPAMIARFTGQSLLIAEALALRGLMDVEAILHQGELKVLEIDARLPSQTPIAVYWSSGYNMVKALSEWFLQGSDRESAAAMKAEPAGVVLEHIRVSPGRLEVLGEHIMKEASNLAIRPGFFGAEEAITDYAAGKDHWVASLINTGVNRAAAWAKREEVIKNICRQFNLAQCRDAEPPEMEEQGQ